jgi:hypothetical protein
VTASIPMMPIEQGFPRPDWSTIATAIETQPMENWNELWTDRAREWVEAIGATLGGAYQLTESETFLVLSAQDKRYVNLLSGFMERARRKILTSLDGIALDDGYGKHVALIFDEQEPYYEYMSYHYPPEGEFALSSGVFLNTDYGHFAFPYLHLSEAEATSAHELTHACLRHIPIPLWLNEGLAVTMEGDICGHHLPRMDSERFNMHAAYWNASTIQEFWSGHAFNRPDEGSGLSYELANQCVRALARDYKLFSSFANAAVHDDAGEAAAVATFGCGLSALITGFFGDGDWTPQPKEWVVHGAA